MSGPVFEEHFTISGCGSVLGGQFSQVQHCCTPTCVDPHLTSLKIGPTFDEVTLTTKRKTRHMKPHRRTALIIGVAAVLTLALPLTGWAADYCGLCEPGTEVEYCSSSATGVIH